MASRACGMKLLHCMVLLALAVPMGGCENARESISMGTWAEAGARNRPPDEQRLKGEIEVVQLAPGGGKVVQIGDLVKIRTEVSTRRLNPMGTDGPPTTVVSLWLWTGREPGPRDYDDVIRWGDLGSPRLRKALIGRSVGEQIEVRLAPGAEGFISAPLRGFAAVDGFTLYDRLGSFTNGRSWPELYLTRSPSSNTPTSAKIEILDACPGRLLHREASLHQWGYILGLFDSNYPTSRQGTLTWSALEGDCASQDKPRFEIGPLYWFQRGRHPELYGWTYSYRRLRPPQEFPDEYDFFGGDFDLPLALRQAAQFNKPDAARILLSRGAEVDAPDRMGDAALTHAARAGSEDTAKFLLERGAKPSGVSPVGWTPLMEAASRNREGMVSLLLQWKADPNLRTAGPSGRTALGDATQKLAGLSESNPEYQKTKRIVEALTKAGARN